MSRTLWALGGVGLAIVLVAGANGFALGGRVDSGLPRHVLIALAATLLATFAHLWAALYLLGLGRAVALTAAEGGLPAEAVRRSRAIRRPALLWIAAALALSLILFVLGGAATTGTLPQVAHQGLAWGAAAAQIGALASERRSLAASEELLRSATEAGS